MMFILNSYKFASYITTNENNSTTSTGAGILLPSQPEISNPSSATEPRFSFFKAPITNKSPYSTVTVKDVCDYITTSTQAETHTQQLRALNDKDTKRFYKNHHFDYCTFSGIFTKCNDISLVQHSGLLCIDFDHIDNLDGLKAKLLNDPYFETELMFVSPSGDGIKWVINIDISQHSHEQYFQAVSQYLGDAYEIEADKSCRNVSRACFLPYDPNCYIKQNTTAHEIFDPDVWLTPKPKISLFDTPLESHTGHVTSSNIDGFNNQDFEETVQRIEELGVDIAPKYDDWFRLGVALVHTFGEEGRAYYHRISRFYLEYDRNETDKQYDKCLNSKGEGVTISTFFFLAKQAGVEIAHNNSSKSPNSPEEEFEEFEESEKLPSFYNNVSSQLPQLLFDIAELGKNDQQKDMLLLGAIVVFSACFPNVKGCYDGATIYPNLYLFVSAPSASGKGSLAWCKKLVVPIHNKLKKDYQTEMEVYNQQLIEYNNGKKKENPPQKPTPKLLFIPANNSSTMFYQLLDYNDGAGLLFETEGDTLSITFQKEYGDFSDGLRKAFHHESISYARRKENEYVEITHPRLSVVLSGTPQQVVTLIKNTTDGLFSRFIYYVLCMDLEWGDVFAVSNLDTTFEELGERFFKLYLLTLNENTNIVFTFSQQQSNKFNTTFGEWKRDYIQVDSNFASYIHRLGLITFRIAMVLTSLRLDSEKIKQTTMICSDDDFETSIEIARVVLIHAYKVWMGFPKRRVPGGTMKKHDYYNCLPQQFDRTVFLEIATQMYIPHKTAEKYISNWCKEGKLKHLDYGKYSKP